VVPAFEIIWEGGLCGNRKSFNGKLGDFIRDERRGTIAEKVQNRKFPEDFVAGR
jgi:hypothetical protein